MAVTKYPLTTEELATFQRDGVLVVKQFYDREALIEPIQRGVHRLVGLLIRKYGLSITQPQFSPETFDSGYQELIAVNRRYGAELYDAVKMIPAFVRFCACEQHDQILSQLRGTDAPGIAAGGYGIRIDNPNEEKFRADWHQDYPAQLRSFDGIVFWSSLVRVTPDIGPVEFCIGSHKGGPVPVHTTHPSNPEKTGAYALYLQNEEEIVARYPHVAPTSEPGDLIVLDYHTIHRSGFNRGSRSRWSMQIRYFNYCDPVGLSYGWKGSFAAGVKLQDVHPELVVPVDPAQHAA